MCCLGSNSGTWEENGYLVYQTSFLIHSGVLISQEWFHKALTEGRGMDGMIFGLSNFEQAGGLCKVWVLGSTPCVKWLYTSKKTGLGAESSTWRRVRVSSDKHSQRCPLFQPQWLLLRLEEFQDNWIQDKKRNSVGKLDCLSLLGLSWKEHYWLQGKRLWKCVFP